jgi:hypothetical protein
MFRMWIKSRHALFKPTAQMSPGLRNFLWPAFDFDAKWIFTHIFTDQLQPFLLELLHNFLWHAWNCVLALNINKVI